MKTFEVIVKYKYDEKELPEGVSESDLLDAFDMIFQVEDFTTTVYYDDDLEKDIQIEFVEHNI